jgi:hypothetical protein
MRSARRTMRPMAGSARSTWRPPGIYTMGGAFWEFGDPGLGEHRNTSCFSAWPKIMPPTRSRWARQAQGARRKVVSGSTRCAPATTRLPTSGSASRRAPTGCCRALIHELFRTGKIDLDYLIRYTNAPWLVIDARRRRTRAVRARRRGQSLWWSTRRGQGDLVSGNAGPEAGADRPVRDCRTGAACRPGVRTDGANAISIEQYAPKRWPSATGIRPTPSAASPPRSPMWPSSEKS